MHKFFNLKLQKCNEYQNEAKFHYKPNGNSLMWPLLFFLTSFNIEAVHMNSRVSCFRSKQNLT